MKLILSNNIKIENCHPNLRRWIKKRYTYDNPVYLKNRLKKLPTWGIERKIETFIEVGDTIYLGRGCEELYDELMNYDVTIVDKRVEGLSRNFKSNVELRDYQPTAVEKMIAEEVGVLVAPAGSGKTVIGCDIISRINTTTLWLVHTEELIKQSILRMEKFISNTGRIGMLYGKEKDLGDGNIIVASVNTLCLHEDLLKPLANFVGLVILDEAHHAPATTFIEVLNNLKAKHVYGLTATPERADGFQFLMHDTIGPVRYEVERQQLYEQGSLIIPKLIPVYTEFEDSGLKVNEKGELVSLDAGGEDFDYHRMLNLLYHDEKRKELIAKNIVDTHRKGKYGLVLADNKQYLFEIEEKVNKLAPDLRTGVITATVGAKTRRERMQKLNNKELDITFATQLAREGLDIAHLSDLHLISPRKGDDDNNSRNGVALEQELGRIMRPCEGKESTVYDYVDYECGVFLSQYRTRCKTYRRLGIDVPRKKGGSRREKRMSDFLNSGIF